jgi:holo-[acyl-carrier protein] synthase
LIAGIGVDLCQIERIASAYERFGDRFLNRILTPWEIEFCLKRNDVPRAIAMRFAAKEAFSKAVGLGMNGIYWREIETRHYPTGQPYLVLYDRAKKAAEGMNISAAHLTLTDEAGLSCAFVVLERQ